jgi:hypothetical protein
MSGPFVDLTPRYCRVRVGPAVEFLLKPSPVQPPVFLPHVIGKALAGNVVVVLVSP